MWLCHVLNSLLSALFTANIPPLHCLFDVLLTPHQMKTRNKREGIQIYTDKDTLEVTFICENYLMSERLIHLTTQNRVRPAGFKVVL